MNTCTVKINYVGHFSSIIRWYNADGRRVMNENVPEYLQRAVMNWYDNSGRVDCTVIVSVIDGELVIKKKPTWYERLQHWWINPADSLGMPTEPPKGGVR